MTGVNEGGEGVEEKNKAKQSGVTNESIFLRAFARDYVDKRPTNVKNQLIKEVMTQDTLSGTLAATGLAEFRATEEKFSNVEIDKIDVYKLRKQLAKGYADMLSSQENFEKYVLEEYDISGEEYSQKISADIASKDSQEISRLLRNDNERTKFLTSKLGVSELPPRTKFTGFNSVSPEQIQSRLQNINSQQERRELSGILLKIQNGSIPRDHEVRQIMLSSLLDESQKLSFIHTFLPYITLQEAIDMQIISDPKAQTIRDSYIQKITHGTALDSGNIEALKEQIAYKDINIRTKDYVTSGADADKVSDEVGFEGFVQSLESRQQDVVNKIKENGPQSFEAMVIILGEMNAHNNYINIGNLSPEKIVKITKDNRDGEKETSFVEIVDFDDRKQEFRFRTLGNERVNLEKPSEIENLSYADFITNLQKDSSTGLEVYSKDTIQEKIQQGDIKTSDLSTLQKENFEGTENTEKREALRQKHIEKLQSDVSDLRAEYANTDDSTKQKEIQGEIDAIEKEISHWNNTQDIAAEQAALWYNESEFINKLDELDVEGKSFGFGKGAAFYFGGKIGEKGSEFGTYTIQNVDYEDWTVTFISEAKREVINLDDFIKVFEEKKAKRMKSCQSMEELMLENEVFKDHKIKNGEIVAKNAEGGDGKREDRKVEYLGSKKSDTIVKINSISGGFVDVQIGERESVEKKKLAKNESSKDILKIKGAETITWTLDELNRFMQQEELAPDWKIGQNVTIVPKDMQNQFTGGFFERWWNTSLTITDILHAGKTVMDGIKESLDEGSHVRSAHAALAMGKLLPKELREDLHSKVEAAESEEMDKALKQLGAVDSWIAVERIERWLLNRNTPESKKEAGLLFMLEKYGHLTSKNSPGGKGLYQYRGKFLWYEAFGGRIGDDLYLDVKKEVEDDGQVFSEEKLMHILLKKQCGGHGFHGIHRRSRLHKEYENKWKSGVNDEFEKGEKDANNFRNPATMIREGIGEATGGTTSNAFGWAKKAVDRGGSQEQMMHIPSAILLSGACFDLDQTTYNKVKSMWDTEGQPVIAFRMFASKSLMQLYNKTVFELSKEIARAYPSHPTLKNIASDAKILRDMSENRNKPEKERLDFADTFWKNYGDVLSRSLNMSLEGDTKYGATDSIIRRKRDQNPVFAEYYNTVRGAVGEGENFKKDYVDDWAGESGIFGLNPYQISLKYLNMDQGGGFREKSIAPKIWDKYVKDIESTRNKLFVGNSLDSAENRIAQEDYIAELLQDIIGSFYEMGGLRSDYIFGLNKTTSPVGYNLNNWGLNLQRDIGMVSSTEITNGDLKDNFRKAAKKIIAGSGGEHYDTPDVLVSKTQQDAAASLSSRPGRDEER